MWRPRSAGAPAGSGVPPERGGRRFRRPASTAVVAALALLAGRNPVAAAPAPAAARSPCERVPALGRGEGGERPVAPAAPSWASCDPAEAGIDAEALRGAVERIAALEGVRAVLVARHGRLLAERYLRGADASTAHDIKSAGKSVLSALVGIALDAGLLEGLDGGVVATLGDRLTEPVDSAKRGIRLRHLLTMTSGLESTSGAGYGPWVTSADWVEAALARPLLAPPGEEFTYSTGNSHLLSAVLAAAAGETTGALAERLLLTPTGIAVRAWDRDPQGNHFGGNQMTMTARDLAAFGQLYLNLGAWNGRPIVPEDWIRESTRRHAAGWPERYGAYGFLWWVREGAVEAYMAVGYGGQLLYVVPRRDMVIVVLSAPVSKGAAWDRALLELIEERIIRAAETGDG